MKAEKLMHSLMMGAMFVVGFVGLIITRSTWTYYNFILFPIVGYLAYRVLGKRWYYAPIAILCMSWVTMSMVWIFSGQPVLASLLDPVAEAFLFGVLCAIGSAIAIFGAIAFRRDNGAAIWKRAVCGGLCFSLIAFVFITAVSFLGNPFDLSAARRDVAVYMAEAYPQDDMTVVAADFNSQTQEYWVQVQSGTIKDQWFYVTWKDGRIQVDDYDNFVGNKATTILRLHDEANKQARPLVENTPLLTGFTLDIDGLDPLAIDNMAAPVKTIYDSLTPDIPFTTALQLPFVASLAAEKKDGELADVAEVITTVHSTLKNAGFSMTSYYLKFTLGSQLLVVSPTAEQVEGENFAGQLAAAEQVEKDGYTLLVLQ